MVKNDCTTVVLEDCPTDSDPSLVFMVRDVSVSDPRVGSVSIPRSILLDGELNFTYSMWITLFDDPNDDLYDGAMGINDDEDPRILLDIKISEVVHPPRETTSPMSRKMEKSKSRSSYMDPIKRTKDEKRKGVPS